MHKRTTVIFDTETTGLSKPGACDASEQPYITEMYAAKYVEYQDGSMEKIGEFEHMFKVPVKLSATITKITGITDEDLANKPTFAQCFNELAEFMTCVDRIVAHNLPFDISMLANEIVRIDKLLHFPWPREHICTVERTLHIEQRRMNLTALHTHLFGIGFPDAHRAKNDVLPLIKCYEKLCKTGVID